MIKVIIAVCLQSVTTLATAAGSLGLSIINEVSVRVCNGLALLLFSKRIHSHTNAPLVYLAALPEKLSCRLQTLVSFRPPAFSSSRPQTPMSSRPPAPMSSRLPAPLSSRPQGGILLATTTPIVRLIRSITESSPGKTPNKYDASDPLT